MLQQGDACSPLNPILESDVRAAWSACAIGENSRDRAALSSFYVTDPVADPKVKR